MAVVTKLYGCVLSLLYMWCTNLSTLINCYKSGLHMFSELGQVIITFLLQVVGTRFT